MRKLCSATGKTIFISPTVAKESRDKHYYDVLRRKIDGRRYKHRRGRAYRCSVYECEYCGGFHLIHMAYWVFNSKKYVTVFFCKCCKAFFSAIQNIHFTGSFI